VNISHHPDDATIMAYAAGAHTEGFSLVLAAHLENCPHCQQRLQKAQDMGGEMLIQLQPSEAPAGGLDDVWSRIESSPKIEEPIKPIKQKSNGSLPAVLEQFFDSGINSVPWRKVAPGISHYKFDLIDSENGSVQLLSIDSGVTIPEHTHKGSELTLVLRGSYSDETGRYQGGDLADLDSSVKHQPMVDSDEPCICLIATDQPLQFSSMASRILQPFIGI
jgi:putative transcriptional regulator